MKQFSLTILAVILSWGLGTGLSAAPQAVVAELGVVDARGHDFDVQPILELQGNWWFWNGQFVPPRDLLDNEKPSGAELTRQPYSFNSRGGLFGKANTGHGTLAVRVLLPEGVDYFEVGIAGVNAAHRIGVSQGGVATWVVSAGRPAVSIDDEIPHLTKPIGRLGKGGTVLSLWIHFSCYHHARGGMWTPPSIAKAGILESDIRGSRFAALLVGAILLTMAFYHLVVFWARRQDKANFWLAMTCLCIALRQVTVGEDLASLLMAEDAGYWWSVHFEYLGLILGPLCGCSYVDAIICDSGFRKLLPYGWAIGGLFTLGTLLVSPLVFTQWLPFEQLFIFVFGLAILYYGMKVASSGNQEARSILVGFVVITFGGLHDIGKALYNFPTPYVVGYCFVAFGLLQSYVLAKRFSYAYEVAERLSNNLKEEVESRTQDLQDQTDVAEMARDSAQIALRQLTMAQKKLIQAEKISALGSLVGGVAHELNNPLNFVRGNQVVIRENTQALEKALMGVLPKDESGDELRELFMNRFNNIYEGLMGQHEGVERASSIVQALRGFATDQVGEKVVHDIHVVLRPALELSRDTLDGIDFETDLPVVMPIECNPAEICQLVMQLLNNAAYAAKQGEGPPRVRLEVERVDATIRLRVTDNGRGIDAQISNRIFDPFVTSKPVGTGTGMGLAMAARVVLDHHGTIDGQNTTTGTVFTVSLPACDGRRLSLRNTDELLVSS